MNRDPDVIVIIDYGDEIAEQKKKRLLRLLSMDKTGGK